MRRNLCGILLVAALVTPALGDALVLKDGRKVIGHVADKKDHYEVQVESQTLTFDKGDVQQWIKSPRELTGDVESLVNDAKRLYSEAVDTKDEKTADQKFREALPKVQKAREALTEARDLFPDGYADLDMQLVNVMKLMRLVRERIHSAIASGEPVKTKDAPLPTVTPKIDPLPTAPELKVEPPPASFGLVDALGLLADPAKRADEKKRAQAREYLKKASDGISPLSDLAMAASVCLSRDDRDWKLTAETSGALQAFFKAAPADKLEALSDKEVGEGVKLLAAKVKDLRLKGTDPSVDALSLLAAGTSSSLLAKTRKATPDLEAAFKDLGFEKSEYGEIWGRKDGLAMDDYRKWASTGEYALGIVHFQKDYSTLPELGPKYALGLLLTYKAIQDNRAFNRAAVQFEILARTGATPALRDHLAALAKSIRAESPCPACGGTHKINCNVCRGKTKFNAQCGQCGGSGRINQFTGGIVTCPTCKGVGTFKDVKCEKCKQTGKIDCKARGCEHEVKPPTFESFAQAFKCPTCTGRGILTRYVAYPCPDCMGLGLILQPKAEPAKLAK